MILDFRLPILHWGNKKSRIQSLPSLFSDGVKQYESGMAYAYNSRPFGSGIGRFSSFAVSIHSWMTASTLAKACRYVGPSAAQPGNSGTSAI
jgi:hypothetical protein